MASSSLPGTVARAPAGLGFDTSTVVTEATAHALREQGYRFCARYLHRSAQVDPTPQGGALSVSEAQTILAAGLGLIPVQYGDATLAPSAASGAQVGAAAASNAAGLGFPPGVTVWCDVEWKAEAAPKDSAGTIAYVNAWADAVAAAGYRAGLYVGPNIPLSSTELYRSLPGIRHYWKAASAVPWVETRGFQLVQSLSLTSAGLYLDADVACYDGLGDRFYLLMPSG